MALLLAPALIGGCSASSDGSVASDEPEVGTIEQRINGQLTFGPECTDLMKGKLQDAVGYALSMFESAQQPFLSCMKDAQLTWTNGYTPEGIQARLLDNLPTHINCLDEVCGGAPGTVGCAGIGISEEIIDIKKDYLTQASYLEVAGVMVHEVSHNKGWDHGPGTGTDYGFTVPPEAGYCIEKNKPLRVARYSMPGATELAFAGGTGGTPFELVCPADAFMQGVWAGTSTYVNLLYSWCGNAWQGPAGSISDSPGSTSFNCATDEVVTGIFGRSSSLVDQLSLKCAKRTDVAAGANPPLIHVVTVGGGEGGIPFERDCPAGMAVKQLYGRSGERIDQLRVVCQSVNVAARGNSHDLPVIGTPMGSTSREQCMGFGLMNGLYGGSGGAIDRVGGLCRPTRNAFPSGKPVIGTASESHLIEASGGPGGAVVSRDECPSGTGLIGLQARVGASPGEGVTQLGGICVSPSQWVSGGSVTRQYTPLRGGSSGTLLSYECPRGEHLVGMQVWSQKTIHATPTVQGITPICRSLATPIVKLPPLGVQSDDAEVPSEAL